MKDFVYLRDVVTLQLHEEKCNGCGMCIKVCPHAVWDEIRQRFYALYESEIKEKS